MHIADTPSVPLSWAQCISHHNPHKC